MPDPTSVKELDLSPIPGKKYFSIDREWRETRGSPSWPERMLRDRIHYCRLIETNITRQNPLADRGRAIHSEATREPRAERIVIMPTTVWPRPENLYSHRFEVLSRHRRSERRARCAQRSRHRP
jgi:hypothetical protein